MRELFLHDLHLHNSRYYYWIRVKIMTTENRTARIVLFAAAVLTCMAILPTARKAARVQSRTDANSTVRVYGALWEAGNGYSTALIVKNRDAQGTLSANVALFSSEGMAEKTAQLLIPPNSTREWDLGSLVNAAASSIQQGGVELDFTGPVAQMSGQMHVEYSQNGTSFTVPLDAGNAFDTENALYAPWWLPDAGTDGEITLFNSSAQAVVVSTSLAVNGVEHSLSNSVVLKPHETKEVALRDLLNQMKIQNAITGSVTLRYSGPAHALQPVLVLANQNTGFVLVPGFNGRHAQQVAGETTWAFPNVGLLDDTLPQPGEIPSLEAYALLSNGTKTPMTPELVAYFAGAARRRGQKATIPVGPMGPSETRLVDLGQWLENTQAIPATLSSFGLEASHAGAPGDLGITVFSMRRSQDFVFRSAGIVLPPSVVDTSHWQMADDQPDAVQNAGTDAAQAQVTLYYQTSYGVESYSPGVLNVGSEEIETLGLAQSVNSGFADSQGNRVPGETVFGLATLSVVSGGGQGATAKVQPAKGIRSTPAREFAENRPNLNLALAHSAGCAAYAIASMSSGSAMKSPRSAMSSGTTTTGVSFAPRAATCGPPPPPVPSSLKVLTVTVLPDGIGAPHGCLGSLWYGIMVDIKYQVFGSDGNPFQQGGMTPHETGTNFFGAAVDSNIGPSPGYPTSTGTTASDGTFHDVPFGTCANGAITKTATQNITIIMSGTSYPVRSQTFTVNGQSVGHGTISNNIGDIAATR